MKDNTVLVVALIVIVVAYGFAMPTGMPTPLNCCGCHSPVTPIIRSGGQYRRVHQGKPRTTDDFRAVRELKVLTAAARRY